VLCRSLFDTLGEVLYELNEDVVIKNFGSFRKRRVMPHTVKHPLTGEPIFVPERVYFKFNASETYRTAEEKAQIAAEKEPIDYTADGCYEALFIGDEDFDEEYEEGSFEEEQ
jgi:nucleoid DNA-binding protein